MKTLKEGLTFKSRWINYGNNSCEVVSFSPENNTAEIRITTPHSEWTEDSWNLQHTLRGFGNGDYTLIR